MKMRFFRCVLAAFFAVVASVSAAEPAAKQVLPAGAVAHFSFAEPQAFLDGLYAYIDAATKDTGYYIPGEMLPMLAVAYSPVPLDAWDMESELHVFLLGDPEEPSVAAIFKTASFDGMIAALEDTGWEIEDAPEGELPEAFVNDCTVVAPAGGRMRLLEMSGGRTVMVQDGAAPGIVAGLYAGVRHDSDADFVARARADGPLGEQLAGLSDFLFEKITGDADDIVDAAVDAGMTEEAGRLLADMAAKYGRAVGEEIEQAEEISLELSFVDDRLVAGLAVLSKDGTWMRRLAETVEAEADGDFPDGTLLKRLPEGSFTSGITASFAELMPDTKALFAGVLSDIAEIDPDRRGELLANNSALFAAGPGAMASANYLNGGAPYQVLLCEYEDPEFALDAMAGMGGAFNDILAASFADPAEGVSLAWETQSDGGREWRAWRIVPANAEGGFGEFLRRLEPGSEASGGMMAAGTVLDPDFRIYAASLEKPSALLIVTGALGREEFAAILQSVADSAGDAETPFDNPEVRATAEALGAAQFSLGVMKPEDLYLLFALQHAAQTGRELPASSVGSIGDAGTDMVFGGGAEDGRVTTRFALPATAVNAGLSMHEALERGFARAEDDEAEEIAESDESGEQQETEDDTETEE